VLFNTFQVFEVNVVGGFKVTVFDKDFGFESHQFQFLELDQFFISL
jgi:hypothetical protein